MGPFVDRFVITGRETRAMAASNKKADVLFALNILSDNFFDTDKDKEAYAATIEEYFGESGDETKTNTDNEEGMHRLRYPMIKQTYIRNCR